MGVISCLLLSKGLSAGELWRRTLQAFLCGPAGCRALHVLRTWGSCMRSGGSLELHALCSKLVSAPSCGAEA